MDSYIEVSLRIKHVRTVKYKIVEKDYFNEILKEGHI